MHVKLVSYALKMTWAWYAYFLNVIYECKSVPCLIVHFSSLSTLFKLMKYMFIYAVMCRWKNADCSVSSYVAIAYFIMIFVMNCYNCKLETVLVVGWLEIELISAFEVLCGRCVRREPGLWLLQSYGFWGHVWLMLLSWIMKCYECAMCETFPSRN